MPVYHFEVRTASQAMITESVELADSRAARIEAAKRIGRLLQDHAGQIWVDQDWQMDVSNQDGLILYVIQISAMMSPATAGARP